MKKNATNKYKKKLINIICGIIGFISPVFLKIAGLTTTQSYVRDYGRLNMRQNGSFRTPDFDNPVYKMVEEDGPLWLDIMIMVLVFWLLRKIIYYFIGNIKHTIVYEDGSKYIGNTIPFTEIRHGYGEVRWPNGDEYYGDFKDNFRTGDGNFIYADGNRYVGKFYKNVFEGYGTFYFSDDNNNQLKKDIIYTKDYQDQFGKVSGLFENGKLIDEYER